MKPERTSTGTLLVRLATPLPCSMFAPPAGTCGRDAYGAYAWPDNNPTKWGSPGRWILQPVCERCAREAAGEKFDKENQQ